MIQVGDKLPASTLMEFIAVEENLTVVNMDRDAIERVLAAGRQALGMARTFQVAQTFEALTVLQNLQLVLSREHLSWWDRLAGRHTAQALQGLAQVGLTAQAQVVVADLPYGAKKRLELAMALAGLPEIGRAHV